jgi:mono/diheme cytochrome c family protein
MCLAAVAWAGEAQPPSPVKGFTAHGGQWEVRDGVVHAGGGAGPKLVGEGTEFADGAAGVEMFLKDAAAGNAGLVVRVSEAGEGADVFIGYEIALDAGRGVLLLGRHKHNFTALREVKIDVPVGKWVPVVARLTGKRIEIDVGGKRVLDWEDPDPLPAGCVGVRPWQRPATYRNLWYSAGGGARRELPFAAGPAGAAAGPADAPAPPELLAGLPPIAFVTRHPLSAPNAVACDIWQSRPSQGGCGIRIFDPARPAEPARTIFRDEEGCIYDMNVSYDARTLLFSYRPKGEPYWHIWRVGMDGSGLRQLTHGPYYDIAPLPLPDGGIMFVSTRRGGFTVCQPGPASNLHRMNADGEDVRCVSMNTLSDFSPQMLPDGRVLFTRWEYVDRDLTFRQSLWTQNPDGTGYQLFFGNTIREVATFWQTRPLPGRSDRVVATFAPHHGWPHGAIGLIDTRFGLEGPRGTGYRWITRDIGPIGDTAREWSWRDPFPLSDTLFLAAYGGGGGGGVEGRRFRICLLAADGRRWTICRDERMGCYNPLALRAVSPPPVVATASFAAAAATGATAPTQPAATQAAEQYGTFVLQDACYGLTGLTRDRVKGLRIMEQVRKTEDLVSRAYDQSPVMSYGTYYAKRCWGTVALEADGSACFRAPALREIYFQLLDAEGREVHRMTSAAQVMPGQTVGCIGCHEPREWAPPVAAAGRPAGPAALRREPARPSPPEYCPDGIVDFPTVVQPVLDKHCIRCHSGADPAAGMTLTGDKTRLFSMAYDNLLGRSRSYRQHDMDSGEMLPGEKAKGKPLVHFFWLLRTPTGVNQPLWAGSHASRLPEYLEGKHCSPAIPAADRQRVYLWIDADVPYYGTYAHSRPKSPGRRDLCTDAATGAESAWYARDYLGVYNRRCQSCHGPAGSPNDHAAIWDGRLAWINFTTPAHSPALTAHLAKSPAGGGTGGRGITKPQGGQSPPLFRDATDADYQTMLKAIEQGKANMLARPRADMPGFAGARKEP